MIPVQRQPEPPEFDRTVRQPGLSAISELVGEEPAIRRRGPIRKAVAAKREELTPDNFPSLWRKCIPHLMRAYNQICAYTCMYINNVTGSASVDHCIPKSHAWDQVYEWDNYRLACSKVNARKQDFRDVLDPFEIKDGMFALDLVSLEAIPGPDAGNDRDQVFATIERLGLDHSDYKEELGEYYHNYIEGKIAFDFLERRAPFLASELRRQNKLLDKDIG
jgi:hypothetical protein